MVAIDLLPNSTECFQCQGFLNSRLRQLFCNINKQIPDTE